MVSGRLNRHSSLETTGSHVESGDDAPRQTALLRKRIWFGFWLTAILMIIIGITSYVSLRRIVLTYNWVERTHFVIEQLQAIRENLAGLERAQRGFLLTHDSMHLRSYREAVANIQIHYKGAMSLMNDSQAQADRIKSLGTLIKHRLREIEPTLSDSARNSDAAIKAFQIAENQSSRQAVLDAIRGLEAREHRLLDERSVKEGIAAEGAIITLAAALMLAALCMGLAGVSINGTLLSLRAKVVELWHTRRKLRDLNESLEQRVAARSAQLQETIEELDAFCYTVSHDLRTPLRAIDGFSRILGVEYPIALSLEARECLNEIRVNTQKMNRLIEGLLTLSKVGRQDLRRREIDMNQLVRSVVNDLEVQFSGRDVELKVDNLPPNTGDLLLLKQVLLNLLGNALKYTRKKEHGLIEIGCVKPQDGRDVVVYFVRDNGAGFDMRYSRKLFGVFQRLHDASEYEGDGVGLAIVQRIVQRHGGRIWAHARVNEGAVFYFTLADDAAVAGVKLEVRREKSECGSGDLWQLTKAPRTH